MLLTIFKKTILLVKQYLMKYLNNPYLCSSFFIKNKNIQNMLKNFLIAAVVATLVFSCGETTTSGNENDQANTADDETQDRKNFGETIDGEGTISYDEMLMKFTEADSIPAKVLGQVSEVCQKKGCWMTIASQNGEETMMVQFKDYGFFVPKDIAGRKVVMEGYAFREITPVDDLKHYAEDAGKSQEEIEAITEPKEEIKFLASGVLLLDN